MPIQREKVRSSAAAARDVAQVLKFAVAGRPDGNLEDRDWTVRETTQRARQALPQHRSMSAESLRVWVQRGLRELVRLERLTRVRHGVYRARAQWAFLPSHLDLLRRASEMAMAARAEVAVWGGANHNALLIWKSPRPPSPPQGAAPREVSRLLNRLRSVVEKNPQYVESVLLAAVTAAHRQGELVLMSYPTRVRPLGGSSVLEMGLSP
jgi:hypothetical protein